MSEKNHGEQWEQSVAAWISGALSANAATHMAAHIAECTECRQLAQELRTLTEAVRALPVRQTSPQFEAQLATRLAAIDSVQNKQSWWHMLAGQWQAMARPALALGAAAAAFAGVALLERPSVPIVSHPIAVETISDKTLLTHCVEQHRSDTSVQPLSDLAAQNLATKLDDSNSSSASIEDSL